MSGRTPAQVLREARRRDSLIKRQRVRATLEEMVRNGDTITFAAVSKAANVSDWLVRADGVREHIEQARARQATQPATDRRTGRTASAASLATDLELAREQIKQLRTERDQLRDNLRLQLGHQLDQLSSKSLIERIDELTAANQHLADQHRQATADNQQLREQVSELEEDLAAARTSLRRVLKEINSAAPSAQPSSGPEPAAMTQVGHE